MKTLKSILFASILLVLTLNSCTKIPGTYLNGASGTTITSTANNYITLKVDGVSKSAVTQFGIMYTSLNSFQLLGQLAGTEVVNISVDNVKVGTFDLATASTILSYGLDSTYGNTFLGLSGTLTITSLTSDTITGTFQFVGTLNGSTTATKTITEGAFKSKFSKI